MLRRLLAGTVLCFFGLVLIVTWFFTRPGPGVLSTQLIHKKTLMTIAYKAYGNPEAAQGKYWLSKLILQNTGKSSLRNIKISYQIPDYITWTTADESPELLPGQTGVFMYYPRLPKSVTEIHTKTPASLEVKIEYSDATGPHSSIEKRDFEFRGITEIEYTSLNADDIVTWYDMFDNNELLAAFVHEEDPVIKAYYGKISEVSGGINVIESGKELLQLEKSIYDFMCSTGMTYSGAKGVPEKLGDVSSTVQSIRLPRDVIYGNSGLCVELALTWASIGEAAGAKPYIVLLPGHAFAVLEAQNGVDIPIECTMIGGGAGGNLHAAGSFDDAINVGAKEWNDLRNGSMPFDVIDVEKLQAQGIRAPELPDKDVTALRAQLDDMRAKHGNGGSQGQGPTVVVNNDGGAGNDGGGVAGMTVWDDPNGAIEVAYPQNWAPNPTVVERVQQSLPGYLFNAVDAATNCGMEVIKYPGAGSPDESLQQLQTFARQMNLPIIFGPAHESHLGVHTCVAYATQFRGRFGPMSGEVSFIKVGDTYYSLGIAAPTATLANFIPIFKQMKANVKIAKSGGN
jgi:hypothetical protein